MDEVLLCFGKKNRRPLSWLIPPILLMLFCRFKVWLLGGDYNDLLSQSEKKGRIPHPISLINGFRETVENCCLLDLGMKGHAFTWEKSSGSPNFIEERLDRALATTAWVRFFGNAEVWNLEVVTSDHSAIFLKPNVDVLSRRKRFCFENSWILEPECKEKIELCGKDLQVWGDTVKHRFKKEINSCRAHLTYLKRRRSCSVDAQIENIKQRLDFLLAQEELFWKQRSKIFWLQVGDTNSKLFHYYASSCKRKNVIVNLQDDSGQTYSRGRGLHEHILQYFQTLFTSNGCSAHHVTDLVSRRIDDQQNHVLIRPFEEK
ncbi:uncharacterized protein [Henckelia pumila]|uniref:uncharacterized protein n=1 Tax=Henckelia pumila TaxID=405737 RepID=UPI003C6DF324